MEWSVLNDIYSKPPFFFSKCRKSTRTTFNGNDITTDKILSVLHPEEIWGQHFKWESGLVFFSTAACFLFSIFGDISLGAYNSWMLPFLVWIWPWLSLLLHYGSVKLLLDQLQSPVNKWCKYLIFWLQLLLFDLFVRPLVVKSFVIVQRTSLKIWIIIHEH